MSRFLSVCVLAVALCGMAQQASLQSDRDWKRWLEEVRPLMTTAEKSDAAKTAADKREAFRDAFWAARNPNGPNGPDNPQRTEFEARVNEAEKRFRSGSNGAWNDCGRTFVLLGKPDRVTVKEPHFSGGDAMASFREQDDVEREIWTYRYTNRLPAVANGYNFRFTQTCESLNGTTFQALLDGAAKTYMAAR